MNIGDVGHSCTGCGACVVGCPTRAVEMRADQEGFLTPSVNADVCTSCGLCRKICPQITPQNGRQPSAVYAAYSLDEASKARSSSGGLFSVVAEQVIDEGGVVFAVALDERTGEARFEKVDTREALAPLRLSKYVQAVTGDVYEQVARTLSDGQKVLFVGCPCQAAAMNNYIKPELRERLLVVDIICHGVPSPKLFKVYLAWLKKREGAPITRYRFRTKERGWGMCVGYRAGGKEKFRRSAFDPYNSRFMHGDTYRESCYRCKFACPQRQGDLTLGDYWGILSEHPEMYSPGGVSMLLVNTDRGRAMYERVQDNLASVASTFEQARRHNINLSRPSPRPPIRDTIYQGIDDMPPDAFVRANLKPNNKPQDVVKALIPWQFKAFIMKMGRRRT